MPFASCSSEWLLSDYHYRVALTVDSSVIDSDLTSFPVLVYLNGSVVDWLYVNNDLSDLFFKDLDNDTLPFEIEYYTVNSEAWLWVALNVTLGSDTVFYLYYGNVDAVSVEDPEGVWRSEYKMVDHMQDYGDTSHTHDSTSYHSDLTKQGAANPSEAAGKIVYCQYFDGGTAYETNNTFSTIGLNDFFYSFWIKTANIRPTLNYFLYHAGGGYNYFRVQADGTLFWRCNDGATGADTTSANTVDSDSWVNIVFWADRDGNSQIYLNGVADANPPRALSVVSGSFSNTNFLLGILNGGNEFAGYIDETRVWIGTLPNAAWVKANYYSEDLNLVGFGSVEPYMEPTASPEPYSNEDILVTAIALVIIFTTIPIGLIYLRK